MITASDFLTPARARGLRWYAGVPCSFLTPFINEVVGGDHLRYCSAANEGDAVAIGAGLTLGGEQAAVLLQNSGLGNAVSPLTSLTYTFRIPLLLVVTWRGEPGIPDEPQHALMGRIIHRLLETMEVPWAPFPSEAGEVAPALARAAAAMAAEQRPYAFVMARGTVAKGETTPPPWPARPPRTAAERLDGTERSTRTAALGAILDATPESGSVVIASTGHTGRELYALADRPNHLYMLGSLGCASALGLGLSLARPDLQVVVVDGDGAALMRMGNLATLGAYGGANLTHILLDNEAHASTGGQATVSPSLSFAGVAAACGYERAIEGAGVEVVNELFARPAETGPRFAAVKIAPGVPASLPRPTITPPEVRARLMAHIGSRLPGVAA